jgi:HD-GYP domain-containing protein (c-di-GMP phosphodiesterase class II)
MHTAAIREQIASVAAAILPRNWWTPFCGLAGRSLLAAAGATRHCRHTAGHARARQPCTASTAQLKQLATLFSCIVDAKSPFTARHSQGVAGLSRWLAERAGLPPAVATNWK